ncbi:MAG TPA: NAD(P)-binding domain-containing protein [Thermoanaerobaculia bacterium]
MLSLLRRYTHWLHTMWPAGTVEKFPRVREDGTTEIPGLRVVGDLTGVPLLKIAADSGARAVNAILAEPDFVRERGRKEGVVDVAIVGAGISGVAAAIQAKKAGLTFVLFEAAEAFATVANFPKAKPIYTYPSDLTPAGDLQFRSEVHPKEQLLEDLERERRAAGVEPTIGRIEGIEREAGAFLLRPAEAGTAVRALRVIVAIGRSGSFRRLGVPGEDEPNVFNRLHDPMDFAGKRALVVGGGDSAVEAAIALATSGAHVTLCFRTPELSRPKPANLEKLRMLLRDPAAHVAVEDPTSELITPASGDYVRADRRAVPGTLALLPSTRVVGIAADHVQLRDATGATRKLDNDVVFSMIGREAPLEFFRRSGISIRGEWRPATWAAFAAFFLFCVFLYNWKAGGALNRVFQERGLFPFRVASAADPSTLVGTLALSAKEPGFYYTVAYSAAILAFGIRRIRRRRTPYVTRQTWTLMVVQWLPLFLIPYVLLPYLGHNGAFDAGFGKTLADNLFPAADYGHGREYWRAFGFILAWPLFIWNVFSPKPMVWWLAIAFLQTFVLIPWMIRRWGKGAYCGWICSCGALAETLGDEHRQKMPHGPVWNRVNMLGQAILAVALLLFAARAVSWTVPDTGFGRAADKLYSGLLSGWKIGGVQTNYYWLVDVFLAGMVGVGTYFWFSGRVWCRFACPLAALMNVYTRFSRFRIFADKKKCISCNVCTAVCHQGIDIMNFANKGLAMEDPQCVRCSACVQSCPTGVLSFGYVGSGGLPVYDRLAASPVEIREGPRPPLRR